jgi:hypothetical protein
MAECKAAWRLHLISINRRNIGIEQKKLAQVLHDLVLGYSSTPSGIYRCAITIWRHLKESLRPQFFFEKADIVCGRLAGGAVTKLINTLVFYFN